MYFSIGDNRNLDYIVERLDGIDANAVIYVASPHDWTGATQAKIINNPDGHYPNQLEGLTYFLEVRTAREVVSVWRLWHHNQQPTLQEKLSAVIHYAIYDSYLQ
jgi:hypothetical protein